MKLNLLNIYLLPMKIESKSNTNSQEINNHDRPTEKTLNASVGTNQAFWTKSFVGDNS